MSGHDRLIARVPDTLSLQDIWQDGRVLLSRDTWRRELIGLASGDSKEHDLSWFDYSYPSDISPDGKVLLFTEAGEGGGPNYSVYQRKIGETSAVRLGDGLAITVSPDGKWVIASPPPLLPNLFFFRPGLARPSLLLTIPSITAGRGGFQMAAAFFSPARNQVTLPVFTSRIPPRKSRCLSRQRESILSCWSFLRTVGGGAG